MPANSPIPLPDSRTEAPSIPASDQGSVISNSQSDSPERILRAGSGQDKDPLLTAQVAWSQNLGHAKVLTTFLSYGEVACQRQVEIIQAFATPPQAVQSEVNEIAKALVKEIARLSRGHIGSMNSI
jgi:hypothetical protein